MTNRCHLTSPAPWVCNASMKRLGRNHGGYRGEPLQVPEVLEQARNAAHRRGWQLASLAATPTVDLPVFTRAPRQPADWAPRIYLSTGIHGDEPAGPLAITRLLEQDPFPAHAWLWCCPCLNPTGLARNTRESAEGIDLNRDYRQPRTPEVRAHVAWLQHQPVFDLSLCLHEDWEAAGFYVYELNPDRRPSLAPAILDAVRDVCPIDLSPMIDGREARNGLIRPLLDPTTRPEWPEALFLLQNKTRLSYTLEAPSDFDLEVRVAALVTAVRAAMDRLEPTSE